MIEQNTRPINDSDLLAVDNFQCWRYGRFEQAELTEFLDDVHLLEEQKQRVFAYLGYKNIPLDMPELPDKKLQILAFCALGNPRSAMEPFPIHSIEVAADDNPIAIIGEVFAKNGEQHSADFITVISCEEEYFQIGKWRTEMAVIADGASMFVPKKYLEKVARNMVNTCTFEIDGKVHFRPDIFWRVALGAVLGDLSMPTPSGFLENLNLQKAFEYAHKQSVLIKKLVRHTNPTGDVSKKAQEILTGTINDSLFHFMELAFPLTDNDSGYNKDTFYLYPSGVLGLMLFQTPVDEKALRSVSEKNLDPTPNGYCLIGDTVISSTFKDDLLRYKNKVQIVSDHDHARVIAGLGVGADPKQLGLIARYRIPFTGNLPVPPKHMELMREIENTPISSGRLWRRGGKRLAVGHTDGIVFRGCNRLKPGEIDGQRYGCQDIAAQALVDDSQLAILDVVFNSMQESRRPDDGAYIIIAHKDDIDLTTQNPIITRQ